MDRRSFLRNSGLTLVGGSVLGSMYVSNSVDSVANIRIHQHKEVTNYLDQNESSGMVLADRLKDSLPSVFHTATPKLTVDVSTGSSDISVGEQSRSVKKRSNLITDLYSWMFEAERDESITTVKESNVLLRPMPEDNLSTVGGYAMMNILPVKSPLYNRYAVVWVDPEYVEFEDLLYGVSHEIGHNLGLGHSYGSNIDKSNSVMLSPRYAESHDKNRFGDTIQDESSRVNRFNSDIGIEHFNVSG